MKFEFIEKEKPKKIWVNETEAHKYLDALIKANPICFREYIEKVRADAIDECISKINSYISHPQLISAIQVIVRDLEKLKEHKNE